MPDTGSEKTLMALCALEADGAVPRAATEAADAARLPSLAERIEMFAGAMRGPDGAVTDDLRKAARDRILTAMAADLLEETAGAAAPPPSLAGVLAQPALAGAEAGRRDGLSRLLADLGRGLGHLITAATEGMTVRRLSMAAVPLVGLLAAGSVLTGNWGTDGTNSGKTRTGGEAVPANPPIYRSLQPAAPVDTPAERDLQNEIAADQSKFGPAHPAVARKLVDLAELYRADGRYDEAVALCARALAMQEQTLGDKAPDTIRTLRELATIYRAQGRPEDASRMLSRANQP